MADIDADFLAIYGIDLESAEISGPRFFRLVHRLTAYTGVMAARVEEERQSDGRPAASAPAAAAASRQQNGDVREVSLTAFRMQFPGLVSMGEG